MKLSIWDILAIVTVIAVFVIGIIFLQIFSDPYSALNPFPPATLPARVMIPTSTATQRSLPPTWTPQSGEREEIDAVNLVSTSTPLPTATGFVLPTFTATLTFTPSPIPATVTPTRTHDQAVWLKQSPPDGATLSPGQDFDMVWTVKNIGTNAWNKSYGYSYASGEKMHKKSSYKLRSAVGIDESIDLVVDMTAPTKEGYYRTAWHLVNEVGEPFYTVTFSFAVR